MESSSSTSGNEDVLAFTLAVKVLLFSSAVLPVQPEELSVKVGRAAAP